MQHTESVCVCVHACVCVLDKEGNRVFTSRALVVVVVSVALSVSDWFQ